MPYQTDETDLVEEEIAFWQGFIEWWERKEGKPATPRMRDALAYAEAKRSLVSMDTPGGGRVEPRAKSSLH